MLSQNFINITKVQKLQKIEREKINKFLQISRIRLEAAFKDTVDMYTWISN